jgi:Domain of unknown function (DUF6362)
VIAHKASIDGIAIIARLEEASRTMMAMPSNADRLGIKVADYGYVREPVEAAAADKGEIRRIKPSTPDAASITRMDEAFAWLAFISNPVVRRVVSLRCLVHPVTDRHTHGWRKIGRTVAADPRACSRWFAEGIDTIASALNRRPVETRRVGPVPLGVLAATPAARGANHVQQQ